MATETAQWSINRELTDEMHGYARGRQAEVTTIKAIFRATKRFHSPVWTSAATCKTTLVSSHRKHSLYSFIFLLEIRFVTHYVRPVYFKNTFFILRSSFLRLRLCQKFPKQNVNSVNWLSNSSLFAVVNVPTKDVRTVNAKYALVTWSKLSAKTEYSILVSLAVMSTVVEQALVL